MYYGYLIVRVSVDSEFQPVSNALVEVLNTGIQAYTDVDGITEPITLQAPDSSLSENPNSQETPFTNYDIRVTKDGLVPFIVRNVEIYPNITSTQLVIMESKDESSKQYDELNIEPPAIWEGENQFKSTEAESNAPTIAPYVLRNVVIPPFMIVHDGAPDNNTAPNYVVEFTDYIKNVACSEIYSTWPVETIKANVAAIVSFTLNRVYTEWYRSKGYNFTITSEIYYDQKYTHGRTIFDSISKVVDEYFDQYIRFPGRNEPFLAHYNDGDKTNNEGWLSQWGSADLGKQGYLAIDILKYYYGPNVTLVTAPAAKFYPSSFPGYDLKLGSCSEAVQVFQNQLNTIRGNYSGIPAIPNADGQFDSNTENTVRVFQRVFGLEETGIVDYATWYKISYIFTAVKQLVLSITT